MSSKVILLISLALMLVAAGSASADLVARWKFDEGSGDVAHDASGNGNDGTFVGDPQWTTGKLGGALEFNGSSDYIEVPFSESLRVINQGDFSIAAWFRLNEIPSEYKATKSGRLSVVPRPARESAWKAGYGIMVLLL